MKLSRNVLVGSLAVSGMVLGALAPAVTAQAARTSGSVDSTSGKVTGVENAGADGMVSAGQLGKGNLAIAYTDSTTGAPVGPAAAYSNASVDVVSGVLVLDQVPDFNFGTAASGSVKGLADNSKGSQTNTSTENNNGTAAIDGNAQGNLQVVESRSTDQLTGFTVSAQVGAFKDSTGTAVTTKADSPFILNLNPATMTLNGKDYDNGKVPFQTQSANIAADATSDPSDPVAKTPNTGVAGNTAKTPMSAPVMTVKKGQAGYTTGTYAAALNTSDLVSLTVPSGIGSGQSVNSLNATITWTLAANAIEPAS